MFEKILFRIFIGIKEIFFGLLFSLFFLQIVNDLFALFYADEVNFARIYDVLEFLNNEDDYSVWYAALRWLNRLWSMYQGHDELVDIQVK